jgi:D-hexose-6-phosphate mutarotase
MAQIGKFATSDIKFIEQNNICPKSTVDWLYKTQNSVDPHTCIDHRRIQEVLRTDYNHHSDKSSWNTTNTVIHNYFNNNVKFNK